MQRPQIRVIELFFLLLLAALTYLAYNVLAPFLLTIFLAIIFTGVLYPMYDRLRRAMGGRRVLAGITMVVAVMLLVAVPVTVIALLVYSEAVSGYNQILARLPGIAERLSQVSLADTLGQIHVLEPYMDGIESVDFGRLVRNAFGAGSDFVLNATQRSFVSLGNAVFGFVMLLLLMLFFFMDGKEMLESVYDVLPMPNRELREIGDETRKTTIATLISTLIIGLMEGTYGAILFLVFGLPSAFLWGVIIMVLSMIPLIGTNLVLIPAAVILILGGRIGAGIAMIVLGFGGVAITQNVVKPKLLGDRSGLHPVLALLATLGGIAWLGLVGFLVGPLLISSLLVVWQQFAVRYERELSTREGGKNPDPEPPAG
jgi:predicted PurR-regulated permease PerM